MNLQDQLNSGKDERLPERRELEDTDVDWSLVHFFILLVVGAVTSVLTSWALSDVSMSPTTGGLVRLGIWALMLCSVLLFQSFLVKSFQLNLYIVGLEAIGLLTFFFKGLNNWVAIGAILFIIAALVAFRRGREDLTDHLRINFRRFSHIVFAVCVTGISFFIACYFTGAYQQANGITFPAFRFLTAGSIPLIQTFVPKFSPTMSAKGFFTELARSQFQNNPQVALLSAIEKEQVFASVGTELLDRLAQMTSTAAQSGESVLSYFYRLTNHYLGVLAASTFSFVVFLVVMLLIFSLMKGVLFIAKWPILWIAFGVYYVLVKYGALSISLEPRSKEIIVVGKRHGRV